MIEIMDQIHRMRTNLLSPYSNGYETWEIKKELYLIRKEIDKILERAPHHFGEEEWLDIHIKEKEMI